MSTTTGHRSDSARADASSGTSSTRQPGLDLRLPQLLGGAFAAVTSALAASSLGVTGTLAGAFFGSLVATAGAAVYSESLTRAGKRLRVVRPASQSDPTGAGTGRPDVGLVSRKGQHADALVFVSRRRPAARRWLRLAVGLVSGLGIALAAITGLELVLGHPVSGATTSGTTVGSAVSGAARAEQPVPAGASTSTTTRPATTRTTASATASVTAPASSSSATAPTPTSATSREDEATSDTETGAPAPTTPARQGSPTGQPTG